MKPRLLPLDDATLARAHQLIMKTNQFNLRSVRHSQAELVSVLGDSRNICALGALADRYGEHGIVALIVVKRISDDTAFLDTFLMSCRVLGRRFETWLLHSIAAKARAAGIRHLVAEYVPSSKNGMCAEILPKHGFVKLTDDTRERLGMAAIDFPFRSNGTRYMMDLEDAAIPPAEVFSEH
jgi:FkbH-like protein